GAARGPDPGPSRARAGIPIVSRRIGLTAAALLTALLVGLPLAARIWPGLLVGIADAFTRAGALVFGGGHVVLPLLGAEPVIADGIDPAQFLGAYGAAQAVPGPLFTFAAPLGFELGAGAGLGWGALGTAALALVAVFVPGVLWLLAALSAWDALRARAWAAAGISGANAAVVGILAAAFVTPVVPAGVTGWLPLAFACLVFVLLTLARWPAWLVVIGCAVGGAVAALCGVPSGW
ncbi:chromate transporter, partial [Leucobacter chromiireducens]|uniref:chromate transporter n=1 Tax=Leucobacter chromiireducens TaxID=283877 RepID=UPI0019D15B82